MKNATVNHDGLKNLNVDTGFTMMGLLPDAYAKYEAKQKENIDAELRALNIDEWRLEDCKELLPNDAEQRAANTSEAHSGLLLNYLS